MEEEAAGMRSPVWRGGVEPVEVAETEAGGGGAGGYSESTTPVDGRV